MSYYIKHPRFGVFVEHVKKASYTWTKARAKGRAFASQAEAQAFRDANPDLENCRVEPLQTVKEAR